MNGEKLKGRKLLITETVLRDAHQSLIATRMRTEDMVPILNKLDSVGYWSLEMWGGATFDSCLRFLKEDPWERLRTIRKEVKNTKLQMLLRGQNLVGYKNYPDDVLEAFIERASENGIDIFRIFDALNDVRNMEKSIKTVKKMKKIAECCISYTISPVHTLGYFVDLSKRLVELGADIICIKDMAGLLSPYMAENLISKLVQEIPVPIHIHTHETSGMGTSAYLKGVENGAKILDTAISPLSSATSQPPTETMVTIFKGTEYDTGLDLKLLEEIASYFRDVRKRYKEYESEYNSVNPSVMIWQIPGGMISNLANQLKEQNALDRMEDVLQEVPKVRKDFGYPPLVTPTSQIVGTQAVLNVMSGERYRIVTKETKNYFRGFYGRPPGKVDEELKRKILGEEEPIKTRPADLLEPELEKNAKELGDRARSIEDVLSYSLFPTVFLEYIEYLKKPTGERIDKTDERDKITSVRKEAHYAPSEFKMTVHGDTYDVKVSGVSPKGTDKRTFFLKIDGVVEEVLIEPLVEIVPTEMPEIFPSETEKEKGRKRPQKPGDISTLVPGKVLSVNVKVGQMVEKGDLILVIESMKMENELRSPVKGIVKEVYVTEGEQVGLDETLIEIDVSE